MCSSVEYCAPIVPVLTNIAYPYRKDAFGLKNIQTIELYSLVNVGRVNGTKGSLLNKVRISSPDTGIYQRYFRFWSSKPHLKVAGI